MTPVEKGAPGGGAPNDSNRPQERPEGPVMNDKPRRATFRPLYSDDDDMAWNPPSPRYGAMPGHALTTTTTTTTATTSTTSLAGTTTTVSTTYSTTTSVEGLLAGSAIDPRAAQAAFEKFGYDTKATPASHGKQTSHTPVSDSPTRRQVARKLNFGQADSAQADQPGPIPMGEVGLAASPFASPPNPGSPHSPYSGASRRAGGRDEIPGFYRPVEAPVMSASQPWQGKNWIASEDELVGFILDREPELLIEEESRTIWQAAMQPSTVALEMLIERGMALHPWQRSSNRGWREEHCPFTAAIKHERADNLRLLLKAGARPGPELELVLSRQPAWAKDIFRQYDYML